eukprot:6492656-Amphidinium_carterae.3
MSSGSGGVKVESANSDQGVACHRFCCGHKSEYALLPGSATFDSRYVGGVMKQVPPRLSRIICANSIE